MQQTDFHEFELFCRKSHFRSLNAQNHFFRASKNTNSVFSATKQIMRMLLSQWEKVAKCNFRSKAQVHEKCFFLMKWTVFCNAEDRFSWVWAFLQKKSFWSLNAQNHFFRASKNTNSVFSATKQIMRMRGPQTLKNFFLSEKKLLNAILRAKLKYMKNVSF